MAALVRATRGPVMLITLGVLMAAHSFTEVRFTQTWPILLIVLGIFKLLEKMTWKRELEQVPPAPTGGFGSSGV
jgi:hypothetical protein